MAPLRNSKLSYSQASSSNARPETKHKHKNNTQQSNPDSDTTFTPGVQKIKARLRSTRRLLAKDKLAADVRVNAERRLKALETELAEAELSKKERTLAMRYHKIKFFERQKVSRKLKQVKRQLEDYQDEKERKKLEKSLAELRVDLNYIQHYPKLKKYISLLPPEARQAAEEDHAEDDAAEPETSQTQAQREEIRHDIRERMARGELSTEPELQDRPARTNKRRPDAPSEASNSAKSSGSKHVPNIKEDAFFGEESDGAESEPGSGGSEDDQMDQS
ncbi:hypothetical protein EIP86_002369 [Pleurotus ostreatoroseus]|nr:hypothetical protein EIP86_002369 [Pleurotus ostreatoroseus]